MGDCTKSKGWILAQDKTRLFSKKQKEIRINNYYKNPTICKFCNNELPYKKKIK